MILSKRGIEAIEKEINELFPEEEQKVESTEELDLIFSNALPTYFIERFLKIHHPGQGQIPFKLYEQQRNLIQRIEEHRQVICMHARQAGVSSVALAYFLWSSMFEPGSRTLMVFPSQQHANFAQRQILEMYESLPNRIKIQARRLTKSGIEFMNESGIFFQTASSSIGRGMSIHNLYIADMAYVDPVQAEMMWASLIPGLQKNARILVHSTPTSSNTMFHDLWTEAVENRDYILYPHAIHAYDIENFSIEDFLRAERMMSPKEFAQSYLCEFTK